MEVVCPFNLLNNMYIRGSSLLWGCPDGIRPRILYESLGWAGDNCTNGVFKEVSKST